MKYRYAIAYSEMTPEFFSLSREERAEKMDAIKKEAEKTGVKLLFWGHPWGTSENAVIVYGFDEIDDYIGLMEAAPMGPYFTRTKTHLVITWP